MKKIIKKIILFTIILVFFLVFNSGFRFDDWQSIFQTVVFSLVAWILIYKPWLKSGFILLTLIFFIFMVISFILSHIIIANFFGTLGFGLLIISGLFYLPQLVKYGNV